MGERHSPRYSVRRAGALVALAGLCGLWSLWGGDGADALAVPVSAAAPAAGSPGSNGSFGLSAAPGASGQAQPYFMLNLPAGGVATATALVTNGGRTAETLRIGRSAGVTAGNGGSGFSGAFQSCSGPACWLASLPSVVTLPGGTMKAFGFRVRVPSGTRPGQYLAGITAELATAPKPAPLGQHGPTGAKAVIIRQVSVAVAVTVGQHASLTTRLHIARVFGSAIGPLPRLNIVLANTGQTFAHAAGSAVCSGAKPGHYTVYADTVLPGDHATIPANATGLAEGATARCTVRLTYGSGQVATWTGPVTIPAAPHTRVVAVGPGDYAALPDGGIPPWAIALIVLGALLLAGLAVIMLRLRRIRHGESASGRPG
jgi:hypothetical protein